MQVMLFLGCFCVLVFLYLLRVTSMRSLLSAHLLSSSFRWSYPLSSQQPRQIRMIHMLPAGASNAEQFFFSQSWPPENTRHRCLIALGLLLHTLNFSLCTLELLSLHGQRVLPSSSSSWVLILFWKEIIIQKIIHCFRCFRCHNASIRDTDLKHIKTLYFRELQQWCCLMLLLVLCPCSLYFEMLWEAKVSRVSSCCSNWWITLRNLKSMKPC